MVVAVQHGMSDEGTWVREPFNVHSPAREYALQPRRTLFVEAGDRVHCWLEEEQRGSCHGRDHGRGRGCGRRECKGSW